MLLNAPFTAKFKGHRSEVFGDLWKNTTSCILASCVEDVVETIFVQEFHCFIRIASEYLTHRLGKIKQL